MRFMFPLHGTVFLTFRLTGSIDPYLTTLLLHTLFVTLNDFQPAERDLKAIIW